MILAGDHGVRVAAGAESEGRAAALLPLVDRRQVNTGHDARRVADADPLSEGALHVVDQVVLLHLVAGTAGDAGVERGDQQPVFAPLEPGARQRHPLDHVGGTALHPLEPAIVDRSADRLANPLVLLLRALRVAVIPAPFLVLEIIADRLDDGAGAGDERHVGGDRRRAIEGLRERPLEKGAQAVLRRRRLGSAKDRADRHCHHDHPPHRALHGPWSLRRLAHRTPAPPPSGGPGARNTR